MGKVEVIDYDNIKRLIKNTVERDHIKQYSFTEANISINDLQDKITKMSKDLKKKGFNGQCQIEIFTPEGPRTGYLSEIGKTVNIWDVAEYESDKIIDDPKKASQLEKWYDDGDGIVTQFNVWFIYKQNAGGCDGDFNDCLWNCIYNAFGGSLPINSRTQEPIFKMPYKLKKYLKIDRKAKVNTSFHINLIENKLKRAINIEGDIIRQSKLKSKNPINLILRNGHYELKKENDNKVTGISYKEKIPLFYKYNKDTNTYDCYDGKYFTLDTDLFYKKLKNPISDTHCMLECFSGKDNISKQRYTLKSSFDEFIEQADKLKEITHGKINLYKTGRFTKTAIKLFYDSIKSMQQCDKIDQIEAQWILNCNRAGHAFVEKEYKGKGYKCDMVSMYSNIMTSNITLPFKKGEYRTITDDDVKEFFRYGIYRAEISNYDSKLFKYNKLNHYTHFDMNIARKHNFTIKMIIDDQPNFLYYSPECNVKAMSIFKPFITMLYDIKSKHKDIFYAKKLMNILWGAFCERHVDKCIWYDPTDKSKEHMLDFEHEIINISTHVSGKIKLEYTHTDKHFETDFARISPFITARGRQLISDIISIDKDNIVRCVTDGLISKNKINIDYGNEIGNMKYEGFCEDVYLEHIYKVHGKFEI